MMTTSAADGDAEMLARPLARLTAQSPVREARMQNRKEDTTGSEHAGGVPTHEVAAYAETARRGDVFPACMRLEAARVASAWGDRAAIALAVGPACPFDVLDTACSFMHRAAEPRLLRAAASIAAGRSARIAAERAAWIARAGRDLEDAARIDPGDATVVILRRELAAIAGARLGG